MRPYVMEDMVLHAEADKAEREEETSTTETSINVKDHHTQEQPSEEETDDHKVIYDFRVSTSKLYEYFISTKWMMM